MNRLLDNKNSNNNDPLYYTRCVPDAASRLTGLNSSSFQHTSKGGSILQSKKLRHREIKNLSQITQPVSGRSRLLTPGHLAPGSVFLTPVLSALFVKISARQDDFFKLFFLTHMHMLLYLSTCTHENLPPGVMDDQPTR